MRTEIWILGGSGYIGQAFARRFESLGQAYKIISRKDLDYTRVDVLSAALRASKPEFVVNCAGYTGKPNVDACELHKAECLAGNAVLPGVIAEACQREKTPWGHVSSGCIFSGRRSDAKGFTELDTPNFTFRTNYCSFYSGTKALGEEVLGNYQNHFVWRLRIPFNSVDGDRNYLSKMMRYQRLLDAENSLSQLEDFARAAHELWTQRAPFGTYNMTNPGSITTREVTGLITKTGVSKKAFDFFKSEDEFLRLAVKTPRSNCVLDVSKLQKTGIKMDEVHVAVEKALKSWRRE